MDTRHNAHRMFQTQHKFVSKSLFGLKYDSDSTVSQLT